MSYDNWKLRAPEDERGYWEGREPDADEVCEHSDTTVCEACQEEDDRAKEAEDHAQ